MNRLIEQVLTYGSHLSQRFASDDQSLSQWIDTQAELVCRNRRISPMQSPDAVFDAISAYLEEIGLDRYTSSILNVLSSGTMQTADHFGGFYSPQSFQGDLLYSILLEKIGTFPQNVPIFSTSIVPLCNCTNPRAIVVHNRADGDVVLPILSGKKRNVAVMRAEPLSATYIRSRIPVFQSDPGLKKERTALISLLNEVYCVESIAGCGAFRDQVPYIGHALSQKVFPGDPNFMQIDLERVAIRLIKADLTVPDTLIWRLVSDPALRAALNEPDPDDQAGLESLPSMQLFKGIDTNGYVYLLRLTAEGRLVGHTSAGREIDFDASVESLLSLIERGLVVPGVLSDFVVTFMARGFTWLGGPFQTRYLPNIQSALERLLKATGDTDTAEHLHRYDCSGYISGPVFMLSPTLDGRLVHAGLLECLVRQTSFNRVRELLATPLSAAHKMGMFEFYSDFVPAKEKTEGWYEKIANYCTETYPQNRI